MSQFPSEVPETALAERTLYNYKQDTEPTDPTDGESWYDTGTDEIKVYKGDSTGWEPTGLIRHPALREVSPAQHHNPVTVSGPLTNDGAQGLGLSFGAGLQLTDGALVASLGNGLAIDTNGQIHVPLDAIDADELDFVEPLGSNASNQVALAVGDGLAVDADGRLHLPAGAVGTDELAADAATATEIAAGAVGSEQASLGAGLTGDGSGSIAATLGNALAFDGDGQIHVPLDAIDADELDFVEPLGTDGSNRLTVAVGDSLAVDANGNLYVPAGAIGPTEASLGNALGSDGSGNIAVQEGSISHDNLSGVSSGDHHTRYSDTEAQAAVMGMDGFAPGFGGN